MYLRISASDRSNSIIIEKYLNDACRDNLPTIDISVRFEIKRVTFVIWQILIIKYKYSREYQGVNQYLKIYIQHKYFYKYTCWNQAQTRDFEREKTAVNLINVTDVDKREKLCNISDGRHAERRYKCLSIIK